METKSSCYLWNRVCRGCTLARTFIYKEVRPSIYTFLSDATVDETGIREVTINVRHKRSVTDLESV